jgi:putative transposase
MPWKERRVMSLRIEFVERVEKGEKVAALCREYGVTRTTGHKWLKRYKEAGYGGLEEESRRPKTTPLATAEEVVMAVLEEREAHPRWGPWKLERLLRRRLGDQTPSERTIARILRRAHKVRERRRRRPLSVIDKAPKVQAEMPNDVWSVDFKGWWKALDGMRCEPLTIRDGASRYVLSIVITAPREAAVRQVFEQLFRRHGLPKAIQCDNGAPFIAVHARCGLSRLSAWWVSLGIRVIRSRPGCPQDNGAHERMHADMAGDLQVRPAANTAAQQRALDRWRQEFNHVRPHQALGGKTPAEVYKVTEKRRPKPYAYPRHHLVRKVLPSGKLCFGGESYLLGAPFAGLRIGIEAVDSMHVRAWLHDLDLGLIETLPEVAPAYFEPHASRARRTRKGGPDAHAPSTDAPALL